jgi:hypothetical protein
MLEVLSGAVIEDLAAQAPATKAGGANSTIARLTVMSD